MKELLGNGLDTIVSQALQEMKEEQGESFHIETVNLAALQRMTGISRGRLRRWKKNLLSPEQNFRKRKSILDDYTSVLDHLLSSGVSNTVICFERLKQLGYTGGHTTVKCYIRQHKHLIPAKRKQIAPQGNRGRRYHTSPSEAYQMDWGFVYVTTDYGVTIKCACFAMICHHCGKCYIEFFPNAKQENLFIGMIHAFRYMGIPKYILTDNMGKVERLVRFVKENFLVGRSFLDITDLNQSALDWCNRQNAVYHRATDCVPQQVHETDCSKSAASFLETQDIFRYLCPLRKISFDGFVNYEGRRFGVPYRYTGSLVRVRREDTQLYIYSADARSLLVTHTVTWSKQDRYCKDQYANPEQPEEFPTAVIHTEIRKLPLPASNLSFEKFNFDKGGEQDE